jgi:hypothetical protein
VKVRESERPRQHPELYALVLTPLQISKGFPFQLN